MDSVEDYARCWAKLEEADENTLSEWIKAVRSLVKSRINKLQGTMSTKTKSVICDPDVVSELSSLHDNYVVVPVDKASNNIVFICKAHYYNCLIKELGINSTHSNPTYTRTSLSKEEILDNHLSVLTSFGIKCLKEDLDLPILYWIPKLCKNPYKQRYIAGSATCSTKPLSIVLTKILTAVKDGLRNTVLLPIPEVVSIRCGS